MKKYKINIPVIKDDSIDLSYIDGFTYGIIIVYKKKEPTGYIVYDYKEGFWHFSRIINYNNSIESNDSLPKLINWIVTSELGDNFELIEFPENY